MSGEPLLRVRGVHRRFRTGPTVVHALRGVSFDVAAGSMVALVGRSGSGKTTLLNIIGGLDRPDAGTVHVDGTDVTALDEDGLSRLRREKVSYVFQSFGLIPVLSAAENVAAPLRLARVAPAERERRVELLLELIGLADHARQRPTELSGGQQQRVAIARALAASPQLLLADEPTGQLDAETGLSVMALLRGIAEAEGVTVVVSTHDAVMMALADRVIRIHDGHLDEQSAGQPSAPVPDVR
ncbi:ABC transporter ATP-binding protein [Micromonospora lupini]|uniref:ABC-transporter ATP binding protein n=1 Tax=Micromonospora lupini str. Lupac 08 TaxID=1150864 RepID=I0KZ87_9ACTN|nr:ABC transporter ATP-binding protein [Micromonospora lupini]CCH16884.1 ABC-transporter ATP binding protein [Micromonospora lupini str. Lupac 08]